MKWLNPILNIGVTAEMSRNNRLSIQTVNGLSGFVAVSLFVAVFWGAIFGSVHLSYGLPILVSIGVVALNRIAQHYFAALLTVLGAVATTTLLATTLKS